MPGFAEVELSRGPILRSAAEFSADGGLNDGSFNTTHPAGGAGVQMLSRVARHEVHIILHPEKRPGPPADSFWDNECSAARIPSLRQAREEALRASIHALSGKTLICTLGLPKNSGETRIIKSPELDLISMDDPGCDAQHPTSESEGRVELRAVWADATDEFKFIPVVSVGPVRAGGEKGRLLTFTFGFATTRTLLPEKLVDLAPCAAHEDHFWELTGDIRIDGKKAIPESAALLWPATCEREPVVCRLR